MSSKPNLGRFEDLLGSCTCQAPVANGSSFRKRRLVSSAYPPREKGWRESFMGRKSLIKILVELDIEYYEIIFDGH